MPCSHIGGAIVCTRGRKAQPCSDCRRASEFLCDFPTATCSPTGPQHKPRTCDCPMCSAHATQVGPDRHFCSAHREAPGAMQELFA